MSKIQKEKVSCVTRQYYDGKIIKAKKHGMMCLCGGAVPPKISPNDLMFHISGESDLTGKPLLKIARYGELKGGVKINIWGTKKGFVKLAEYLLSLAHLDTRADSNYHQHLDRITSYNSSAVIDLTLRKNPKRNWPNNPLQGTEGDVPSSSTEPEALRP
ncbi:MAG: hypothetical protein IPL39_01430 [Opitutaceae bacterium]|nr:hypothetical protein [Opitutaceae bacterium]